MKICIFPDVHENWDIFNKNLENALNDKSLDKIILLGDYCDCHDGDKNAKNHGIVTAENIKNLANIDDPRLDRLIGNHDFKYIAGFPCSGPSDYYKWLETYKEAFLSNLYKFKIAVKYDNWIFSHAGFSSEWFENVYNTFKLKFGIENPLPYDPVDLSNKLFWSKYWSPFDFSDKCNDPYGDSIFSPPTWIRPPSLIRFGIEGYNQCVGHTVLTEDSMSYWNLEGRVVDAKDWYDKKKFYKYQYEAENEPKNLDCKYVFIDSPENNFYAVIDTVTNEVEITSVS